MGRKKKYTTDSARKRANLAKQQKCRQSKVTLGFDIAERWRSVLVSSMDFDTDGELATYLLDRYAAGALTSTPHGKQNRFNDQLSGVSPIDGSSIQSTGQQSRAEPNIANDEVLLEETIATHDSDPLGLVTAGSDSKDDTYGPSQDSFVDFQKEKIENSRVYRMDVEVEDLEECDDTELVHEIEEEPANTSSEEDEDATQGMLTDATTALLDTPFIGYTSCLLQLAKGSFSSTCPKCKGDVNITSKMVGTCVILKWTCMQNHLCHTWSSQPKLTARGNHLGDFMLALNTLLSGNNYTKIAMLMKFVGFKPMTNYNFFQLQGHLAVPTIREHWQKTQRDILMKLKEKELVLAGDGRNDSPGHSSQYCSYTLMDEGTHDILTTVVVDKRQVNLKSPNMEALGLRKALKEVREDHGMKVKEVVTDAHTQIPPILRELDIDHNWDVWHGSKNLSKKLNQAASAKDCKDLQPWVKDIVNHFWFCSENAQGNALRFKSLMRGVLQHVRNVHTWDSGDNVGVAGCLHEPIEEEDPKKPWLVPGSPAHKALQKIIYDGTWLKNAGEKYKNFRHTGELEVFHHHLLMYAAKRFAYSPPVYEARVLLAALDFQHHKERDYKRDRNGQIRYRRIFNKKSSFWSPVPMKAAKKYGYMKNLQKSVIERLFRDRSILQKPVPMAEDDPRRLRSTIASVLAEDVTVLLSRHKSRKGNARPRN